MDLKENIFNIHVCPSRIAYAHVHDYLELAYVLHGSAVHKINEAAGEIISEGDYFIIDYNTIHSYISIENRDFSVINCLFRPQLVDKSLAYCKEFSTLLRHYMIQINGEDSEINIANHIFHDDDGRILHILNEMLAEYRDMNIGWIEILRSKLIELLVFTARKVACSKPRGIVPEIINKIHANYAKNLTLGEIAEEMHYSLPYISKLFKEKTGLTFRAYVQKIRIEEACRLLAGTDEKISCISIMVGYADTDFFCRLFKSEQGVTPKSFRAAVRRK